MSKSGKNKPKASESQEKKEKVLTRYDLKMQRRKEQKEREEREKKITTIVGILIVAALACVVASFPIRSYLTVHGTYIMAADEKVSRVEFDYNYNLAMGSYLNQNYYLMSLMGIDLSGDLSRQMYSDTLTWQDFFEQRAVDNLLQGKALKRELEAAGFTYDVTEDYEEYLQMLRDGAAEEGMTLNAYVRELYGPYATESRIRKFVQEAILTGAYYDSVAESKTPSDEEIQAYYENDKDSFDSVDYRQILVEAELPTEPTALADPVEETEEDADAEEETEYVPSEAEISFAMAQAMAEAEEVEKTVLTKGELNENLTQSEISYLLRDWLFDSARVSGDTTIIEDSTYNRYYVVAFVDRYLDNSPSADVRVIMTENGDEQTIFEEWKAGEATEESFAVLADRYNDSLEIEGGLLEALIPTNMPEVMADWIFDGTRTSGDTTVIASEEEGVAYVIYYVGKNDPAWKLSIKSTLLSETMSAYMEEIVQGLEVKDPHGNLYYLQVQAMEEAAAENDDAESSDNSGEDGEDTSSAE